VSESVIPERVPIASNDLRVFVLSIAAKQSDVNQPTEKHLKCDQKLQGSHELNGNDNEKY